MIFRQLCPNQFDAFTEILAKTGQSQPLDASYTVCITVDGDEYRLKVQPCQRNKVAVLQAVRIQTTEQGPTFRLITENLPLSALFELFLFQTLSAPKA